MNSTINAKLSPTAALCHAVIGTLLGLGAFFAVAAGPDAAPTATIEQVAR